MTQNKNQNIYIYIYLNTNNFYGHAMSKLFDKSKFNWIDPKNFNSNK